MHKRILFVINRKSGSSDSADLEDLILNRLNNLPVLHEIYYISGENDTRQIMDAMDRFRPDLICAAGGDGTINMVASLMLNKPVTLGIIPTGSANGLAFEFGIPENLSEALDIVLNGSVNSMDVVQVNQTHISLHLSDVGFNARIVSEFEKEGGRGFKGYIKQFLKELKRPQKSFKCEILINDSYHTHRAYMTVIANSSKYRTGANINPTGRTDDGVFEVIVFKAQRNWIWKSLIAAFTGTLHKQPHVETYRATEVKITIKPPQDLQVDGESLGMASHCTASILKHALQIVLPVSENPPGRYSSNQI